MKLFTTFVYFENFRIFLAQPRRRRGRRSSEDYRDFVFSQDVHCPMQPRKIKFPFRRLHQPPGKFRHTHIGDAGLSHQTCIFLPQGLRRLVRIVVNSEKQRDWRASRVAPNLCPEWETETGCAKRSSRTTQEFTPAEREHDPSFRKAKCK